ncbi:hypothetical protein [Roseomonas sp. HF4]|uniref:hypothetical protein n=1 Tax=Roseomonas sp. HF4 TaxID=2562313 RepID=UPI0010C0DFF2|nr:hypothetical protein [Roseomonas sp. HF4]
MLKVAALAFIPIVAVLLGTLAILVTSFPSLTRDFTTGASLIYGGAALCVLLAIPLAWLVARRMLLRREKRLLDAAAGRGA